VVTFEQDKISDSGNIQTRKKILTVIISNQTTFLTVITFNPDNITVIILKPINVSDRGDI